MFRLVVRRRQSDKDAGDCSTSRGVRTWRIPARVIIGNFSCFSQRGPTRRTLPMRHGCVVPMRWANYAMPVCVLFVSSTSVVVFNQNTCAITDRNALSFL